ncbi:MAG: hypothetical protein IJD43_16050 [Thermoguttaceae bacterium]|nr:hypothetical protein [Thermoguttaceae bacterium]
MKKLIFALCFLLICLFQSSVNAQREETDSGGVLVLSYISYPRPQDAAERTSYYYAYQTTRYPAMSCKNRIDALIYDEGTSDHGRHFEDTMFVHVWVATLEDLTDFSFRDCVFLGGLICFDGADYTGSLFLEKCDIYLSPKQLMQTKNYKLKILRCGQIFGDFPNVDFSGFEISCEFLAQRLDGAKFHNAWFIDSRIPVGMSQEQFKQTKNYRTGIFLGIYNPPLYREYKSNVFQNLDISGMNFSFCKLYGNFSGTDMTNTVFTECYLSDVENLTLEQVKSTWNYKAGRISLCKWPEYIEKALEEEEKAKAQEEKK